MDVAIGLPNAVPGATGAELVEWARRAEARGFSSLGTIDRLAYPNYEPLVALSAAAAVTERIGLSTSVLLGPLRANAAAVAKQTLSLQALSAGRLTFGIGLGGRDDDYEVAELETGNRGGELERMLTRIKELWESDTVGPHVGEPPTLLIGGGVDASFARAAEYGDGWIAGAVPPEVFAEMAERARAAWSAAGRAGEPRLAALAYYALGDRAEEDANSNLKDYYAWLGKDLADYVVASAAKDADAVQDVLAAFAGAGCDELIFFPSSSDPVQVDLLADAAGL